MKTHTNTTTKAPGAEQMPILTLPHQISHNFPSKPAHKIPPFSITLSENCISCEVRIHEYKYRVEVEATSVAKFNDHEAKVEGLYSLFLSNSLPSNPSIKSWPTTSHCTNMVDPWGAFVRKIVHHDACPSGSDIGGRTHPNLGLGFGLMINSVGSHDIWGIQFAEVTMGSMRSGVDE